jgi:hypothetical protein
MYRALVLKELRDLRGVLAAAAFAAALITATLAGAPILPAQIAGSSYERVVRFTSGAEEQWIAALAVGTALAFGYWQSVLEIQRGTALYLFHRPLSRRKIVLTKLAVGLILQMLIIAIPTLVLGVLAGWPGFWPAPFAWSMTWNCWAYGAWALLVYLAASASGWLEARWFGMRLAPLAAVVPLLIVPAVTFFSGWWLLVLLPFAGLLTVAMLRAAESRDF